MYADSSKKDFYKLRVDFDVSDRINLSGLKSDPNTFLPLFSKDFKGVDNPGRYPTTDGWHKMKIEVRTINAYETSFWCYFDGVLLAGCPIIDSSSTRNTSGGFGLYSFQQSATGLPAYFDNIVVKTLPTDIIFSEDFETGTAKAAWGTYYAGEDSVKAKPMSAAPKPLTGGGNYVGLLQDINGSYTGSAVSVAGALNLKNYSIEADVYCYVNQALSAYSGLVVYADSSKRDFYKLRVDFDVSDRINLSGLKSDPNTFLPLFSKDFKGVDNPGRYPTTDGWHKMRIEVRNTSAAQTSFWCFFDGVLLTGCPIVDTTSTRNTSGGFGLYSFQQSATGLPAYFDNIVVRTLGTASPVQKNMSAIVPDKAQLSQNYPNPFNPETRISFALLSAGHTTLAVYDILGRHVKTLISGSQSAGYHEITWDGQDAFGKSAPSGVYIYSLSSGNVNESKKMILMR
ncbi:MAG: T9SS type A sorting domain-containing protein [Ignavibacteriales bacterium]|nr:T9SS type A sorting domain-containing protein [Ignavibacteriales bacterium]